MKLDPTRLELCFAEPTYGLSARRLWEHTELAQVNVFDQPIRSRSELNDAADFIDVVWLDSDAISLAGFTLADLRSDRIPKHGIAYDFSVPRELGSSPGVVAFVRRVADHLHLCSIRQATRNQHHEFLPQAQIDDVFGVPLIFSALQQRLRNMGRAKASAGQWLGTIENFRKKGLRAEEIERSQLIPELAALDDAGDQASACELEEWCNFKELRLSVIPVIRDADTPDEAGQFRRQKTRFHGLHAVMLDDLGTKASMERLTLPPSWLLETSAGNHQAG